MSKKAKDRHMKKAAQPLKLLVRNQLSELLDDKPESEECLEQLECIMSLSNEELKLHADKLMHTLDAALNLTLPKLLIHKDVIAKIDAVALYADHVLSSSRAYAAYEAYAELEYHGQTLAICQLWRMPDVIAAWIGRRAVIGSKADAEHAMLAKKALCLYMLAYRLFNGHVVKVNAPLDAMPARDIGIMSAATRCVSMDIKFSKVDSIEELILQLAVLGISA